MINGVPSLRKYFTIRLTGAVCITSQAHVNKRKVKRTREKKLIKNVDYSSESGAFISIPGRIKRIFFSFAIKRCNKLDLFAMSFPFLLLSRLNCNAISCRITSPLMACAEIRFRKFLMKKTFYCFKEVGEREKLEWGESLHWLENETQSKLNRKHKFHVIEWKCVINDLAARRLCDGSITETLDEITHTHTHYSSSWTVRKKKKMSTRNWAPRNFLVLAGTRKSLTWAADIYFRVWFNLKRKMSKDER